MRKINSTNTRNKVTLDAHCGMAHTLSLIGGRWKPSIMCRLLEGRMRYNELRKGLTGVSERMLVLQLRELERDGLVKRIVYAEVPPRVEYELTADGRSMQELLKSLSDWGIARLKKKMKEEHLKAV
ncbi:transcriptional regulator [Paraflavitalea soli]|uniref:Transcriptional regulator n=1 Tax=Paraflavitalea soli TaxID=2315862 RepID=A0A3B7MH85_9BACT|nr:helix-turn-helix domain-containing protein [Paraflavitalea soli]AXY72509.1 transcriptional regulator [Paraflavitalea soli]